MGCEHQRAVGRTVQRQQLGRPVGAFQRVVHLHWGGIGAHGLGTEGVAAQQPIPPAGDGFQCVTLCGEGGGRLVDGGAAHAQLSGQLLAGNVFASGGTQCLQKGLTGGGRHGGKAPFVLYYNHIVAWNGQNTNFLQKNLRFVQGMRRLSRLNQQKGRAEHRPPQPERRMSRSLTTLEFSAMVQQYQSLVYTVCHQLVPDVGDAQDLTQETFLAAWRAIDRCPPGFEKQWLARIAANKAKDYLRSAWVRRVNTPGDEVLALEGAPPGLEPEQQVLDTLGAEELTRMILDLREPYKTPCRLVLLEQHTMAEAARLCGRPEKTVNAQIYRAKKMLVQQIREQQEGRSVHGTV